MVDNSSLQPGDAVQYQLSSNGCVYGLVLNIRLATVPDIMDVSPVVARVAFVAADPAVTSAWMELTPDVLVPLPDPELQAFLAANIVVAWPDDANAVAWDATASAEPQALLSPSAPHPL